MALSGFKAPIVMRIALALLVVIAATTATAELPPEDAALAAGRILERSEYQTQIPAPADRQERNVGSRFPTLRESRVDIPGTAPLIAKTAMWLLVAILSLLAIIWLASQLTTLRKPREESDRPSGLPPSASTERFERSEPIGDAAELARRSLYADAIHVLLLRALQQVTDSTPVPESFTSREVLGRVPLPGGALRPLQELVSTVEATRFGRAAAGESEYLGCVASYRRFRDFLARRPR